MIPKIAALAFVYAGALVACSSFSAGEAATADDAAGDADGAADEGESSTVVDTGLDQDGNLDADGAALGCRGNPNCIRTVFVTSATYMGSSILGPSNGDTLCTMAAASSANGSVHGKDFVAWLSTSSQSANMRLVQGMLPYVRPDGMQVALNWLGFASSDHMNEIDFDETGAMLTGTEARVWTGTTNQGAWNGPDCGGWMDPTIQGAAGTSSVTGGAWSQDGNFSCTTPLHLFCIER